MRSTVSGTNSKRLVAAAHNGYPNGDQPFYLLIKVPRNACFMDWQGKRYIYFNSSYAATRRGSWYRKAGVAGLAAKGAWSLLTLNPNQWHEVEESAVGTVFPFKWNVDDGGVEAQEQLLNEPNLLGGPIWLDEMDKIKHSEILALLEAEANFVTFTRNLQSTELKTRLDSLDPESERIRSNVNELIERNRDAMRQSFTNREAQVPAN